MTWVVFVIAVIFLPIPGENQSGAYNLASRLYYCKDEYTCLHEQAHYIDHCNGRISGTGEFREAAVLYILVNEEYSLIGYPIGEIYAELYAMSGGNMPDPLERFYPPPPEFRSIPFMKGRLYYAVHDPGH